MIGWWLRRRKKAADEAAKAAALARSRKEREDKDFDDFLKGKIKVVEPELPSTDEMTDLDRFFAIDLPSEEEEQAQKEEEDRNKEELDILDREAERYLIKQRGTLLRIYRDTDTSWIENLAIEQIDELINKHRLCIKKIMEFMDLPIGPMGQKFVYLKRLEERENSFFVTLTNQKAEIKLEELKDLKNKQEKEKEEKQILVQKIYEIYPKALGFELSAHHKSNYYHSSLGELKKAIKTLEKKVQARKKQEAQNKAHRLERKREEEAAIAKRKKDRLEAAPRVLRERKLLFKQAYQKHYTTIK